MSTSTIEQYLPQTAAYINWIFAHDSEERGGHHNYVVEQSILNSTTRYTDMSADELVWADVDAFKMLYALDDEPSIFSVDSAYYDEEIGSTVTVILLDEELEFIVQLAGGDFLSQMGCQISHKNEGDYYADADKNILDIFFNQIINSAETAHDDYVEELKETGEWELIEESKIIRASATSSSMLTIERKIDFDKGVDDYEYRVIPKNSGFIQPNDYNHKLDFTVEHFSSLTLAQEWVSMSEEERHYKRNN